MLLAELKKYLQTAESLNLLEITRHLAVSPDVARDMLAIWLRKGMVVKQDVNNSCANPCLNCSPLSLERYAWRQ